MSDPFRIEDGDLRAFEKQLATTSLAANPRSRDELLYQCGTASARSAANRIRRRRRWLLASLCPLLLFIGALMGRVLPTDDGRPLPEQVSEPEQSVPEPSDTISDWALAISTASNGSADSQSGLRAGMTPEQANEVFDRHGGSVTTGDSLASPILRAGGSWLDL